MNKELTEGNIIKGMVRFSVPYLIACFLQTFYGLADLFITGQFNGSASITAVSVGSQVMHMLTVMIVGLAMGATVSISRQVGAGNKTAVSKSIGNTVTLFLISSVAATFLLLLLIDPILGALSTPEEALAETRVYLTICFAGIPFITAYNVISSIFRGLGDTKHPMYYVAVAGVINVVLDYILIGPFHMGAKGAALATVISQAISVILAFFALKKQNVELDVKSSDLKFEPKTVRFILAVGVPIALQDGLIQISFLIITAIANSRGVDAAAAVGIVEKIIGFLFLVPSAMLSTVSALSAQNAGAGKHERSREVLKFGVAICVGFGMVVFIICQFISPQIVSLFVNNNGRVAQLGGQYLKAYSLDCAFAGIHFCFSGFFSAYGKSLYSFVHNIISIVTVRVPGAYLASVLFPATLYPMGLAAPLGSLLSAVICVILFRSGRNYWK